MLGHKSGGKRGPGGLIFWLVVQEAPNFNPLRVLLGTLRFNTLFDIDSANILRIDAIEICPWVTLVRPDGQTDALEAVAAAGRFCCML